MRRGRVDETKAAADEHTEVDAVAKGGDDRGLGEGFGGVGDPKIGAEKRNEESNHDPLGPKTMKQLVARQSRRGATETGGEAQNRRGRRTPLRTAPRHGRRGSLDVFFLFYLRSAREEGNVDNAARNDGGGISMVHRCGLKNLLMVKVRALEILKLRTTRNNPTKDRPTQAPPNCSVG